MPAGATQPSMPIAISLSKYVMLDGVNDSPGHADQLAELLLGKAAKINLIPFNPFPGNEFRRSPTATIQAFQNRLRRRGLVVTTRKTRGDDIDAACGQLGWAKYRNRVRVQIEREEDLRMATA